MSKKVDGNEMGRWKVYLWLSSLLRTGIRYACPVYIIAALFSVSPAITYADECSNEQRRLEDHSTQLPDCRGYELVTSPYKDGYSQNFRNVSPDGEHVLFQSIGKFAGAKGNENLEGTLYESLRTSSGWHVKALSPSASIFGFAEEADASIDLTRTLWEGHTASQSADANNLYIRMPDGSFVLVGPEVPPLAEKAPPFPDQTAHAAQLKYRGASSDLSHIVFAIEPEPGEAPGEDIAWPGDKTLIASVASLYEYSGVSNQEPRLVAVRNKGRLSSNLDAEMITQCGSDLGGGVGASTYNAISGSGSTIFFTAHPEGCENEEGEEGTGPRVAEIYARINEMETIDISEPSHEDCLACNTSSPKEGVFEGASQDGSKAFFLSGQEGLLPGAEGMNLYEYNFDSAVPQERLIRVSGQVSNPEVLGVVRVSEDGSHVYFVAKGDLADNQNVDQEHATSGDNNLYVVDTDSGKTAFIGSLSTSDKGDWKRADDRPVMATPDGEFLVFSSQAHLTPDDHSGAGVAQIFEYDAATEGLARISIGKKGSYFCDATEKSEEGYNCDGNTENETYSPATGAPDFENVDLATQPDTPPLVSPDGRTVIFFSFNALAPQATNSLSGNLCRNVYEYRRAKNEQNISAGDVSLVSDGKDVAVSAGVCGSTGKMNPSGSDLFVQTTDPLVSQDVNTQIDIYDAREGGGFSAEALGPRCVDDSCQGALSVAPELFSPGSTTPVGGDFTPRISVSMTKGKTRQLSRAQKLVKALAVCRKKQRVKRKACKSEARKRYGAEIKAKKASIKASMSHMRIKVPAREGAK